MKKNVTSGAALLLASILISVLASCGGNTAQNPSAETAGGDNAPVTEAVTEEQKPDHLDSLGEYDFGGKDFNMLVRQSRMSSVMTDEAIGEVYNDAVFNRNSKIAERFNIKFTAMPLEDVGATWNKQISSSVMANDGAYDVVMPDYWWGCETGGYFLNMLDYSSIMDFKQPWWCAGWNDSAEIYGQMYSAVGSLCMDLYSNAICVFFNKNLINGFDMESPYELVDSRKWTVDKMMEMAMQVGGDFNGDGVLNLDDDRYGAFYDLQSGRALFASCGWKTATKTADGAYAYEFWGDEFVALYDRIYSIINESDYVAYNSGNAQNAFRTDRLLFLCQGMGVAAALRDMESDFGIVPYPLYNDAQENYITYNFGTFYLAIPKSASDPEMSAVILEALNAESYNTVKDAYYEVNMKEKFSRDENTQRMLDIIVDTTYFDFTFVNESATDHIVMYFFDQVTQKNHSIASAYEKKINGYQKKLDKLFETYAAGIE